MTMETSHVATLSRISTPIEAEHIGRAAYGSLMNDLYALEPEEWNAVTVCAPWTVADMVRHLIGAAKANASMTEMMRQQIHGARHKAEFGGNALDATNDLQVRDHDHLGPSELIAELEAVYPKSVRARTNRSRLFDRIDVPVDESGSTATGMPTKLSLGELFRVVYTRDVWLHRIDIARALGRDVTLHDEVDGRIVEDVVKEWSDRHGRPFDLRLDGAAGGHYVQNGAGPRIHLDAVEFCWILSGREEPGPQVEGRELLAQRVLF